MPKVQPLTTPAEDIILKLPNLYQLSHMLAPYVGRARIVKAIITLYPPYLFTGLKVDYFAEDFSEVRLSMGLYPWNRNYVGTQFGGSMYSIIDPWFMLLLMEQLGREFIVWDKSGQIRYRKPGRGTVYCTLKLPDGLLEQIHEDFAGGVSKKDYTLHADLVDGDGVVIAQVEKVLHVRRKKAPDEPKSKP